jgi:mycoredoxin
VIEVTRMFGIESCSDCQRTRAWLRRHDIPFTEIDAADPAVRAQAAEIAGGRSNVPVLVTPDGTVLVEPSNTELAAAFGVRRSRSGSRSGCR